jgi:hypothetical protein
MLFFVDYWYIGAKNITKLTGTVIPGIESGI